MAYKDKEKQRQAVREAVKRHRQGITGEGITQEDVIPSRLTIEQVKALTPGQCKAILSAWLTNGTAYQRNLALLAGHYGRFRP